MVKNLRSFLFYLIFMMNNEEIILFMKLKTLIKTNNFCQKVPTEQ